MGNLECLLRVARPANPPPARPPGLAPDFTPSEPAPMIRTLFRRRAVQCDAFFEVLGIADRFGLGEQAAQQLLALLKVDAEE